MEGLQMFIDKFVRFLPKSGLKKALRHFNKGEYGKACRAFESYLSRIANEPAAQDHEMVRMYMVESYIEYARELSERDDKKDAADQLERAIVLQPSYADVHYNLGILYDLLGRATAARDSYTRALTINPTYFRARVNLAQSYHADGNIENTVMELEASYAAAPNFFIEQVKKLISLVRTGSSPEEQDILFHQLSQ